MRKITKTVTAWDCGDNRCCHIREKFAIACRKERLEKQDKEKKSLLIFKDYMTTRVPLKYIAKKHGVSERTIRFKCNKIIERYYNVVFTEEIRRMYGADLKLVTAVNKWSSFWRKQIIKSLSGLGK